MQIKDLWLRLKDWWPKPKKKKKKLRDISEYIVPNKDLTFLSDWEYEYGTLWALSKHSELESIEQWNLRAYAMVQDYAKERNLLSDAKFWAFQLRTIRYHLQLEETLDFVLDAVNKKLPNSRKVAREIGILTNNRLTVDPKNPKLYIWTSQKWRVVDPSFGRFKTYKELKEEGFFES